jgi:hypothetical protein
MKHLAALSLLILGPVLLSRAATVASPPTPPAAVTKVLDLFDRLRAAQEGRDDAPKHVAFNLTEAEINEYMRYALKTTPRPGLDSLTVKLFPKDYISTFSRIDFDAVERWHPGTIPTVLRPFLKGKKSIQIDCRIHAADSKITFTVEKARYEDMPLPAFFVEKMIQLVAARQPEKYDTSRPMPIPFGLSKIFTTEHVIQGSN